MKNIPAKIYLQLGTDREDIEDFKDLSEVTWSTKNIHGNDIEYVLSPVETDIVDEEQEDWQQKLYNYMASEFNVSLLESDMAEIKDCIIKRGFPEKPFAPVDEDELKMEDLFTIIYPLVNPNQQRQFGKSLSRKISIELLKQFSISRKAE